ncbi:MAG: DNA recombination protein RmuC, partial [Desulfobacterales bacterium]|nr:DNA recombination protein RmuC [Desulfobacterales bacterium]
MDLLLQSAIGLLRIWRIELLLGVMVLVLLVVLLLVIRVSGRLPADGFSVLRGHLAGVDQRLHYLEEAVRNEATRSRQEAAGNARSIREELRGAVRDSGDSLLMRMAENAGMQKNQLDSFSKQLMDMTRLHEEKFEALRHSVESRLRDLQQDNSLKLEQMRATVDEKLHDTLEKRLGESFQQVGERLEQVYKGLGEMRNLAVGVGDLKKVLTNVKTRGTWGEIRLGAILEQILTPDQYGVNVVTRKNSAERVEYAVRLPGPGDDRSEVVWLPIDAKFPQEDYQRLVDAQEAAEKEQAEKFIHSLEIRIKAEAKFIREKYIDPPHTTDFGILFLPVEGLYAEVLRRPGLCDFLQREYRVVLAGPTTLAALLNSLQMGFRTLAVEKRSSEVWQLLGMVKTEFGKFGDVLARTKKKLQEASNTIDSAQVRTRVISRKLEKVQEIPLDSPP